VPFDLRVEGHEAAIVYAPVGTTRRPVLVAVHGSYDVPEWFCPFFRDIAGNDVFVICPRGVPRSDGARMPSGEAFYTYAGNVAIEKEVEASLAALRARFPEHVDERAPVYLGWSLGALTANAMIGRHPERFPRIVLAEGTTPWTAATARAVAAAGGKRVLYMCGQPGCVAASNEAATVLERAGIATKVVYAKGGGHAIQGAVAEQLRAAFPWITEDDPRWNR
jgi:predicted esterase